jgi:hypothetical protein
LSLSIGLAIPITALHPLADEHMTYTNSAALSKVADRLYRMAAPQNRAASITEETEVYLDLGIYGDEIVDLVWWLEKEFQVKTNIDPFRFAPREANFFGLRRAIRRMLGREAQYESLKVRDLIAAIEAKRWPDEA